MYSKLNVLILGASYGSLFASKVVFAGHNAKLVCLPEEANLLNAEGAIIRLPVRAIEGSVELKSIDAPGRLNAAGPGDVEPKDFDLICLAMQEPQYRVPEIKNLLNSIAKSRVPCMSIMNMPPLPFLARIPGLDEKMLEGCYTDPTVWSEFDPDLMTLASPDPQAFRPPDQPLNVLQVALPTNFKVARFSSDAHTALLRQLETDIDSIRLDHEGSEIELPVKLRVNEALFVPLAKWSMLLTGNYRCVLEDRIRPIAEAVHSDIEMSRQIYEWVSGVCQKIGASPSDLVPFEKYTAAATGLTNPSSAARALAAGAQYIERVDALVKTIADLNAMSNDAVNASYDNVENWLRRNRQQ